MEIQEKRKFFIDFSGSNDRALAYFQELLDDTRTTTLLTIRNFTEEELHWQYKEGWNTIGALLSHIAALGHHFRIEFVLGRRLTDDEHARLTPALDMGAYLPQLIGQKTIEEYVEELRYSHRLLLDSLQSLSFEDFVRRIEDYDPETGCNLAWVLYHSVEDEIYHRGQISMIRKLYNDRVR